MNGNGAAAEAALIDCDARAGVRRAGLARAADRRPGTFAALLPIALTAALPTRIAGALAPRGARISPRQTHGLFQKTSADSDSYRANMQGDRDVL